MKFGEKLEQESVPEWSLRTYPLPTWLHVAQTPYQQSYPLAQPNPTDVRRNAIDNVDYNSLKHEIKVHTTRDQATAVTIPGQRDSSLEKFEENLYMELCRQHDRVDLFVNSKVDEISRRLGTSPLHLLIMLPFCQPYRTPQLTITSTDAVVRKIELLEAKKARDGETGITLKRQRRLVKYERELLRCEEDILAVSRFINAQVTAFRKIIKKYRVRLFVMSSFFFYPP